MRTYEAKIELALTYTFWLSYYAAPLDAAYQLIVASAPRRATLGIYKTPVAAHRLGEHTQLTERSQANTAAERDRATIITAPRQFREAA